MRYNAENKIWMPVEMTEHHAAAGQEFLLISIGKFLLENLQGNGIIRSPAYSAQSWKRR